MPSDEKELEEARQDLIRIQAEKEEFRRRLVEEADILVKKILLNNYFKYYCPKY